MIHSNKTDYNKLKNMSDDDIDYSDIKETDYDFWSDAEIILPHKKAEIKLQLDEDIVIWINQLGDTSNSAINNLLRSYYLGIKQLQIK
jgi:uncharacterized protein (DUF4415 family)